MRCCPLYCCLLILKCMGCIVVVDPLGRGNGVREPWVLGGLGKGQREANPNSFLSLWKGLTHLPHPIMQTGRRQRVASTSRQRAKLAPII